VISKAKGKKKFLKIFIITLSSLILLSLIAFWVMTSSVFITGVVLPMVSKSIDLQIDAEHVDLSIFKSRLKVKNLLIWSGKTPLVKAEKLDGGFSLFDLLGGRFVFRDVLLDKAVITIAKDSDGRWNYESPQQVLSNIVLEKTISSAPPVKTSENEKPEKVFLDLKNIQITNSSFVLVPGDINKASDRMEFKDLNINIPQLKNNAPGTLTLKSRVSIKSNSGITVEQGKLNTTLTAAFDDYLHPYEVKLDSKLDKLDGVVNGVKINNSNLTLNVEAHGDKKSIVIKKFSLRQTDKKFIKTNVQLSSYINFEPFKIKGKIKIAPLSSEIISIISQFAHQVNPGKVGVSWVSDFEYSKNVFSGAGKLKLTRRDYAVIGGKKYKLPNLSLNSKYDFNFDNSQKSLNVKYFTTELKDRNKKVLSLHTDRAFTYFFEKQAFYKKRKPQVSLELRQLDLSIIKLLQSPGENFILHGGQLDGDLVCILDYKRKLRFGANIKGSNLDIQINSKRFKNLGFEQKLSGFISKNLFLSIPKFRLNLKNKQENVLSFAGVANVDFKKDKADFSLNLVNFPIQKITKLPLPQEIINEITQVTTKLDAFSLTAASSGSIRLDEGTIKLNPVNFNVFQQKKKVLNLLIKPHEGMIENIGKRSTSVLSVTNLSIKQFKKLISDDSLAGGYLNGKIIAKVKDDFKSISMNSALTVDELELLSMKRIFKNLRFNLGFTSSIIDFDEIKIQNFVCGMRKKNRVILGLSGFGNLKLSKGIGKLDLSMDHLNHHSLNIITPGKLKSGTIKGGLKVNILDNFKNWQIKSNLDIVHLIGGSATEPVEGKSSFDMVLKPDLFLCKKFFVRLNSKDGEIVTIDGSTILPEASSGKPVVIKLSSRIIDIGKIEKLFAVEAASNSKASKVSSEKPVVKTASSTKPPEPLQFNLGKKSYVLLVDLRGIKYNSALTARVNSKILGKGRKIDVKHLQITSNKDKINFRGDLLSTAKGIKYNVDLKSNEFNLNPIIHSFLKNGLQKMKGTLKKLDVNLSGTGLQSVALWDNMKGYARTEFANVKVPNDLSRTTMGKILLLPFEIMIDIQKMVPNKALEAMGQAAKFVVEFRNNMKVLNFDDGKMDLESGDGIILIKDFHLNGKTVKNLSFVGKFGLGSRQLLDLKSHLNVNGIILPVEMSGTVQKPKINYSATTLKFMTANAFTILDTTGEILEKGGGDVKKILDIIFN
jgi:AsmA-like C-terminal region